MHLKNFSLFNPSGHYQLTPAYDLLPAALVMPEDPEELALTLNGIKRKITRHDFETAMTASGLNDKAVANIFKRFEKSVSKWHKIIDIPFLPDNMKSTYKSKIDDMMSRLVGTEAKFRVTRLQKPTNLELLLDPEFIMIILKYAKE